MLSSSWDVAWDSLVSKRTWSFFVGFVFFSFLGVGFFGVVLGFFSSIQVE